MTLFASPPPIVAIDVANLAHRAYHANKHLSIKDDKGVSIKTGHVYGSVKILLGLVKRWTKGGKPPELWFALEGKPTRRLKLYPDYKGNREPREFEPYPGVRKAVLRLPGRAYYNPNMEADDILAMLAHPDTRGQRDIILVTTDRDLWKFVGAPHVKIWCKDHFVSTMELAATFGVEDRRAVPLSKALFGDSTDNIKPAVPKMRKQPVLDLINSAGLRTIKQFELALDQLPDRYQERLQAHWTDLTRNWEVVKLPSKPKPMRVAEGPTDSTNIVKYLETYKCRSLYDAVKELWG